jgi:hypothetical protein
MAKNPVKVNADPLSPAQSGADWEAHGWVSELERFIAAPRLETTISIRFDPDSALLLRRAARMKGLTKSQFIRQATVQEARKTIDETPLPATMWIVGREDAASTSGSERTVVSRTTARPLTTTRSALELITR